MTFWLKFLHIAAVATWFAGLLLLPWTMQPAAAERAGGTSSNARHLGDALYFGVTTPAAVLAIILGIGLTAQVAAGPWLAAKLMLVAMAVLIHVHAGKRLLDMRHGRLRKAGIAQRLLDWSPLLLFAGIAALTAGRPSLLPAAG